MEGTFKPPLKLQTKCITCIECKEIIYHRIDILIIFDNFVLHKELLEKILLPFSRGIQQTGADVRTIPHLRDGIVSVKYALTIRPNVLNMRTTLNM